MMRFHRTANDRVIVFALAYILVNLMILFSTNRMTHFVILIFLASMILSAPRLGLKKNDRMVVSLYAGLLFSTVLGMINRGAMIGYVQFVKIGITIVLFTWFLYISHRKHFVERFMDLYCIIAFIISIQCLILFVVVMFNIMPGHKIYKEARGYEFSYGILGYGQATNIFGSYKILRTNSFFREPSKLAGFLIPSLFWLMAKFKEEGRMKFLVPLLVTGVNFFFTFSRAGYVAFLIGLAGLIVFRPKENRNGNISRKRTTFGIVIIIAGLFAVIWLGHFLYRFTITSEEFYASSNQVSNGFEGMLMRSFSIQSKYNNFFIRDDSSFALIFDKISHNPLGYGLGWSAEKPEFNNPTGLGFWLYSGGIVSAVAIIFLYFYLLKCQYLVCMFSKNVYMRALGASFVGLTVQEMSYGSWIDVCYLFIIALMISLVDQHNMMAGKEKLKWPS